MDSLYIIDASGYIYRSYFAIRQMTNHKGESTNALFGFIRSIQKLIKDFHPTHLVSVFDGPRNALKRKEIYPEYKAHRSEMPKDLLHQIYWAQKYCQLMGLPELMVPEVEADDTMGSVAKWAASRGAEVYLCTSDKDMCQLVNEKVFILNTFKENLVLNSEKVEEQYGVTPNQMIDYLAITGDASDNVPGLPGFGPKTAVELLKQFGTLENLLAHPNDVTGKKKQEVILQNAPLARLSQQLVTIDTNVSIPDEPHFYQIRKHDVESLREFYTEMSFSSMMKELEQGQCLIEKPVVQDEKVEYVLVDDEESLTVLIDKLSTADEICLDTETTGINTLRSEIVGIGLGVDCGQAYYIPMNGKLGRDKALSRLKPLFEDTRRGFYGHHLKYDYHILANYKIHIANICFDTILASYLLNSHLRQHSLDYLSLEIFNKVKIPIEDLIGKGKKQITMRDVEIDRVKDYCCEDVDYTMRLKSFLSAKLEERGLMKLLKDMELPLLPILAQMERKGIFVDVHCLSNLSGEFGIEIEALKKMIFEMAGEEFNLNSPKQLSQILYEKMGIKCPKKTATGLSTNADVLESLSPHHPIAKKILEYRSLEKLRSTYIDSLPSEVNPNTHRIHCTFNQSGTATGRLSCQDPNLQNIPVRTEEGLKIREAFRPQNEGWSYLSADYSQIELRLLAHLSDDPALIRAFRNNEDIHAYTASLIFDVPLDQVNKEQRYQAKAVNFGIVYGQQAYGLSQELGIEPKKAANFIEMYFNRYNHVKAFLDSCKESARQTGKSVTLIGRERLIPEINNQNGMIRTAAERLAINTPLQGTAADLIKLAMIQIDKLLKMEKMKSFMVLQIHDELIFEAPDDELDRLTVLVKKAMEEVMPLKVPLIVNISIGKNWKEC